MIHLEEYRQLDNCIIVGKFDEGKLISFGVADKQMELVTSESFETAYDAFQFAKDYIGLCCER